MNAIMCVFPRAQAFKASRGDALEVALRICPRQHSLRRTKVALIYKRTGNLRACQLLLGRSKLESSVRYLGIEVDDALLCPSRRTCSDTSATGTVALASLPAPCSSGGDLPHVRNQHNRSKADGDSSAPPTSAFWSISNVCIWRVATAAEHKQLVAGGIISLPPSIVP